MVPVLTEAELLGKVVSALQKAVISLHINSVISYCVIAILFMCKKEVPIYKSVYMLVGLESIAL
jgi:hypothetical protein